MIAVSSHIKSGTVVVVAIIENLTGKKALRKKAEKLLPYIINENRMIFNPETMETDNVVFKPDGGISINVRIIRDKKFQHFLEVPLSGQMQDMLFSDGDIFYAGYQTPDIFFSDSLIAKAESKIFVCRDFRDAYNSYTKFVTMSEKHFNLMNSIGSYSDFQYFSYLNLDMFRHFINTWKNYAESYLRHKEKLSIVRYEDLMANPVAEIMRIAEMTGNKINECKAEQTAALCMNRELTDRKNRHCHTRHYSGSEKIKGDWASYFNRWMCEEVKKSLGGLLIDLGYEKDTDWSEGEPADKNFREKLNRACEEYCDKERMILISVESYLEKLKKFASAKRVAVYGGGFYGSSLVRMLNNSVDIVLIADDAGGVSDIDGISVVKIDELVRRFREFDLVFVAVHKDNTSAILDKLRKYQFPEYLVTDVYDSVFDSWILGHKASTK